MSSLCFACMCLPCDTEEHFIPEAQVYTWDWATLMFLYKGVIHISDVSRDWIFCTTTLTMMDLLHHNPHCDWIFRTNPPLRLNIPHQTPIMTGFSTLQHPHHDHVYRTTAPTIAWQSMPQPMLSHRWELYTQPWMQAVGPVSMRDSRLLLTSVLRCFWDHSELIAGTFDLQLLKSHGLVSEENKAHPHRS